MLVRASHTKVLINGSPETLGGCAGLKRQVFILKDSFVLFPPRPSTLGGCAGLKRQVFILKDSFVLFPPRPSTLGGCCDPGRPVTVKAFVLKGLPPPLPKPPPGLLRVDFCLPPLPPHPLPLFGLLPLNRLSILWPSRGG